MIMTVNLPRKFEIHEITCQRINCFLLNHEISYRQISIRLQYIPSLHLLYIHKQLNLEDSITVNILKAVREIKYFLLAVDK
jgi:hypothetical protein